MKEKMIDRIRRKVRKKYDSLVKWMIRKAVMKHDDLNDAGFMVYSFSRDEITDYHVIAERSFADLHVYGTKVEKLKE